MNKICKNGLFISDNPEISLFISFMHMLSNNRNMILWGCKLIVNNKNIIIISQLTDHERSQNKQLYW